MLSAREARRILETAELVYSAAAVSEAVSRVASEITAALGDRHPLLLSVMGGAVVFTGSLLTRLRFPLDFDYVHVTRYSNATAGGAVRWIAAPHEAIDGRVVLILDDILDEGVTLAAIRDRVLELGASACYSAVFADKDIGRPKPISADFVGVRVPNRYVFGYGMDVHGVWRNLPEVYALRQEAG
jgi:hypoxanthine phosphoribosyltransferase